MNDINMKFADDLHCTTSYNNIHPDSSNCVGDVTCKKEDITFPQGDRFAHKTKKLNSVALVRERTIPTERPPLVGEEVPTFADRGCRMVSATDSQGR
jgi:hypothetical protein